MTWKGRTKDYKEYQGFVYIITNNLTGQYYIGKKFYWSKRTRPPLKGKKRKRHYIIESDWKTYWGSSNKLQADLKQYKKKNFTREILTHCKTKFDCAYEELKLQMYYNVLDDPKSYNEIVNVRLRKRK